MKTVRLLQNVHLSPNFGLGRIKYKDGPTYDAPKGSVEEVQDDIASVLVQRGLAEITTAAPAPNDRK